MRIEKPFANYQLNNSELVRLAADPKKATLERFLKSDERQPYTGDQLKQAYQQFGFNTRLQQLEAKQDKAWSSWECGMYRRLTLPHHDPAPPAKLQGSECAELAQTALNLFDRLDHNQNGRLSASELDQGLHQDLQGADAAALVVMRCYQKSIGTRRGITRDHLQKLASEGLKDAEETRRLATTFQNRKTQQLAPKKPIMEESFDPKAIRQGSNGTCVSLSTLIGTDADHVRSMFHDNGDGSVTIRLKDGSEHRVQDVTQAERLYHARGADDERWPALLELALGQRLGQLAAGRGLPDRTPRSHVATGQTFSDAFSLMLGQKRQKIDFDNHSPNEVREKLARARGPLVTASRWEETVLFGRPRPPLKNGVIGMHAYAVLGYDEKRDVVTVRNPWHKGEWLGAQDGKDDGTFEMPFLQFYASYGTLVSPDGPTGLLRSAGDLARRALSLLGHLNPFVG